MCGGCGSKIVRGGIGLAKAGLAHATGIGQASLQVYKDRLRTCWHCDKAQPLTVAGIPIIGKKEQCAECKCVIKAKAAIASERCPLGKWN